MIIGTYSDDGQAPGRTPVVDLVLPDDAVTQTFAILGKRGSGKSSAAKVMAEEMHAAGHQWVAVDPKGDWHGLRSSVDGKQPGLPIPVFGGLHGDLDLSPAAGAVMAELIVTQLIGRGDPVIASDVLDRCHHVVQIPAPLPWSMNVAQAAAIVIHDRYSKVQRDARG